MVEDGYGGKSMLNHILQWSNLVVLIRDSTWALIRESIRNSQDITVPLQDDNRFIIQWRHNLYHSPIDGGSHAASWKIYNPSVPARPSEAHVNMAQIVFLVEPPNGTVSTQELCEYIKAMVTVVEEQTPVRPLPAPPGNNHPGRKVVVEFQLPKCEGWLKMTANPSLDGIDVQSIMQRIATLPAPEARSVAKLQIYLDLWGYQGPTAQFS